jgi:hypothetical protein
MIKAFILILTVISLSSCKKQEGCVILSNEYRLWVVSANERFLTTNDDLYFLGPRIESMAVTNRFIIGKNPKYMWENMKNDIGYFTIDILTNDIRKNLSEDEFQDFLHLHNITNLALEGPGEIMKRRYETHRCH